MLMPPIDGFYRLLRIKFGLGGMADIDVFQIGIDLPPTR
jgi:hypothetical protein